MSLQLNSVRPAFTPEQARLAGQASGQARRESARAQATELQRQAWKDGTNEQTPVHIRAAAMRAWCDLTQVLREMDGLGKPKPVSAKNDPDAKPKRKSASIEPRIILPEAGPGEGPSPTH